MSDSADVIPYSVAGFCCGIYLFGKGLLLYRKYRLLADTPEIPIAGAAMGLVEIHGKASGEATIKGPVSGTPCYYYKVDVEGSVASADGGQNSWHVGTETKSSRFYLEDASGRILVDPSGAQFDVAEYSERVVGRLIGDDEPSGPVVIFGADPEDNSAAQAAPTEDALLEYVAEMTSKHASPQHAGHTGNAQSLPKGMYTFKEYCVVPGRPYDITGTCAENPSPRDTQDHNLLRKGEENSTFLISSHSAKDLKGSLRRRVVWFVFGGGALAIVSLAFLLLVNNWL